MIVEQGLVVQGITSILSGILVGFSLALIGGGGSILALPLLLYFVGIHNPHIAIGTTSLAVAFIALYNLIHHHLSGYVKWNMAIRFAVAGVIGAAFGSELGKLMDGKSLIFLFALLMLVIGYKMLMQTDRPQNQGQPASQRSVYVYGSSVGLLAGFFGIGGGFLIVPALMRSCDITIIEAIGSSLVSVAAFGLVTAANYAFSGLVSWHIAMEYVVGGLAGGWGGVIIARKLGQKKDIMRYLFSIVILTVAIYMIIRQIMVY